MPNWCEGTLKVRGTIDNLKNFIQNGLISTTNKQLNIDGDEASLYVDNIYRELYLKGSQRAFCEPDYIEVKVDDPNDYAIITMPFKQAWSIVVDDLYDICKEFNVDMKIQVFERGMEFSQIIEIVNGKILQDEKIEYDNWDWDCPFPDLGG